MLKETEVHGWIITGAVGGEKGLEGCGKFSSSVKESSGSRDVSGNGVCRGTDTLDEVGKVFSVER